MPPDYTQLFKAKKYEITIRIIITKPPNCLVNSGRSLILAK